LHAARDAGRNFVVCRRTVHIVALETVRPDFQAVGSVDQLNVDAGPRSLAFDAAFDDVSHSKFVADGGDIHASVLIGERGLMRHDPEAPEPRKRIIEIFRSTRAQYFGLQHRGDRRWQTAAAEWERSPCFRPSRCDARPSDPTSISGSILRARTISREGEQQCQQADAGGTDVAAQRAVARACAAARIAVSGPDRKLSAATGAPPSID
jgi:hypothetical protein